MKKQITQFFIAAAAGAFCLSAACPGANCKEIAMSKCSRETSADGEENQEMERSCNTCNSCQGDQSSAEQQVRTHRRSAAQKVMEGE